MRSFANILLKLADTDQEQTDNMPVGARSHELLRPDWELSHSSHTIVVGRLDAKGTGDFYNRYVAKKG